MSRSLALACSVLALAVAAPAALAAAKPPAMWDGLVRMEAKHLDSVYLLPDADFRDYTKVMLEPPEVAFRKNWQRDYNESSVDLSGRISDADAKQIADKARAGFEEVFKKAYADAGYAVVTEPGPDVLKLRTAVIDLYVAAPDLMSAGRSRTYSSDAGEATVVVEARDSVTGAILGRAVDRRTAGDVGPFVRNSVSNRADFGQLFRSWAKASADGLETLQSMSPIQAASVAGR